MEAAVVDQIRCISTDDDPHDVAISVSFHRAGIKTLAAKADIESGQVETFQQLAELGRNSQPRMTQIMSLLNLAPNIQEELLYLPEVIQGKAAIHERLLRPLTRQIDWKKQRKKWEQIKRNQLIATRRI